MLVVVLGTAIAFSSCEKGNSNDDKDDVSHNSQNNEEKVVEDQSEWYVEDLYDNGISQIDKSDVSADYRTNQLSFYNYVDDKGKLKNFKNLATTKRAIQIIDKSTLAYWTFQLGIKGCQPSLTSDYHFNSTLEPLFGLEHDFIYYSTSHYQNTYVEIEGKIVVSNGRIYTKTARGLIQDGVSGEISKASIYKSNFKTQQKIATDCPIKVRSECNIDYDKDIIRVHVNSDLASLYPSEKFVYGVEYGLGNYNYIAEYLESNESSFDIEIPIAIGDDGNKYMSWKNIKNNIEKKMQTGTISSSEQTTYDNAVKETNKYMILL